MKGQLQLFEPLKKSQCSNYKDLDWPPFCWLKKVFHDLSFGLMGSFQLIGGYEGWLFSSVASPTRPYVFPLSSLFGRHHSFWTPAAEVNPALATSLRQLPKATRIPEDLRFRGRSQSITLISPSTWYHQVTLPWPGCSLNCSNDNDSTL